MSTDPILQSASSSSHTTAELKNSLIAPNQSATGDSSQSAVDHHVASPSSRLTEPSDLSLTQPPGAIVNSIVCADGGRGCPVYAEPLAILQDGPVSTSVRGLASSSVCSSAGRQPVDQFSMWFATKSQVHKDGYDQKIEVRWPVTPIAQVLNDNQEDDSEENVASNGCWAAAIAMLMQHRYMYTKVLTISEALGCIKSPDNFLADLHWRANVSITEEDKARFINGLDLAWMGPSNLAPKAWYQLLAQHGPLWTTSVPGSAIHARVLVAYKPGADLSKDLLSFIDPRNIELGEDPITFDEWLPAWEKEVRTSLKYNYRVQLAFNRCQKGCLGCILGPIPLPRVNHNDHIQPTVTEDLVSDVCGNEPVGQRRDDDASSSSIPPLCSALSNLTTMQQQDADELNVAL